MRSDRDTLPAPSEFRDARSIPPLCGSLPSGVQPRKSIEGLQYMWTYEREHLSISCYARRWRYRWAATAMPQSVVLKPVEKRCAWILYFIYAPNGHLDAAHRFTLAALSQGTLPVLAVVACRTPDLVPASILESCASVIWKALPGYDFSAYAIGLGAIARQSTGADVLVFNDSVFGPFGDLTPYLNCAPWDLTGFMATDGSLQKHIQSYAFVMKEVTRNRLDAMGEIMSDNFAFDTAVATICCRELWMARQASYSMSVGSFWYGRVADVLDPTLSKAIDLVDAGFPFMKRSLLSKQKHYQPSTAVLDCLQRSKHPIPDAIAPNGTEGTEAPRRSRSLVRRAGRKLLRVLGVPTA